MPKIRKNTSSSLTQLNPKLLVNLVITVAALLTYKHTHKYLIAHAIRDEEHPNNPLNTCSLM